MDILPTLAALVDADLPADRIIDGKDIRPLIFNDPEDRSPYEAFYYYNRLQLQAIRNGKWKLHFSHGYHSLTNTPVMDGVPGEYEQKTTGLALYDLEKDLQKRNNLAWRYPDIVDRIVKLGGKAKYDLEDALTKTKGRHIRPCGRL